MVGPNVGERWQQNGKKLPASTFTFSFLERDLCGAVSANASSSSYSSNSSPQLAEPTFFLDRFGTVTAPC